MKIRIIEERLKKYELTSAGTDLQAIREITQELILYSLSTSDFFTYAAFQGGTCLRIIHGLNRFSEDMDFILKIKDPSFSWQSYLSLISTSLNQYGYKIELQDKSDTAGVVKKAFIKDDSIGKVLKLAYSTRQGSIKKLRIKLEIDTNPPGEGKFETKFIGFPSASSITTETIPTLLAGKSHALLCRPYEKGRDWYDFLWYMAHKTPVNYQRLASALNQTGPWKGQELSVNRKWYISEMKKKIENTNWDRAKEDVFPFISQQEHHSLSLWNSQFFLSALEQLP